MKQYVNDYINFLKEVMDDYSKKEEALKLDDRKDESILYKVRVNICDIFAKMVNASDKKVTAMKLTTEEEQTTAFNEDYLNWFVNIPASWKTNMELAKKHDDVIVAKTEEIKLETADLLRHKFLELSGYEVPDAAVLKNTTTAGGITLHIGGGNTTVLAEREGSNKTQGKTSSGTERNTSNRKES